MGLTEQARSLVRFALTAPTGFAVNITLTNPNFPLDPVTIPAVCTKHNLNVSTDQYGNNVSANTETSRVIVDTKMLTEIEYTWMNANNHAAMLGNFVEWTDASGNTFKFIVAEQWPNANLGLITLMLQAYKP